METLFKANLGADGVIELQKEDFGGLVITCNGRVYPREDLESAQRAITNVLEHWDYEILVNDDIIDLSTLHADSW